MHHSRSHHAVIHVYETTGNVIETDEHNGETQRRTDDRSERLCWL
jgi:hypothetical protein